MSVAPTIVAITAGLLIEVFFQLIKYRDKANSEEPRVVAEYFSPTHYMSVSQYVASGSRRWARYFAFRHIPPLVILVLLASVIQRYFEVDDMVPYAIFASAISLIARDARRLLSRSAMTSEKIIHIVNIAILMVASVSIGLVANHFFIGYLAPSPEGVVDNLWAALFTAMLVAIYIKVSTMPESDNNSARYIELSNMVLRSYRKIAELYRHAIAHESNVNNTSIPLLYAILIYEDINRPAWLRKIENMIVRVTGRELTVGIAQVKSRKPLTDVESISRAALILKDTQKLNTELQQGLYSNSRIQDVIRTYNDGSQYQSAIVDILNSLHIYAGQLFTEGSDVVAKSITQEDKE